MATTANTEFRGTDDLYIAQITKDDATDYTAGTPKKLAPTAEISRTVSNSSETHYYSNVPLIVVTAKGTEQIVVTTPVIPLADLGEMLGIYVDTTTGALIDTVADDVYYAIMYRIQKTDGTWRYVVKQKARLIGPPEEVSQTRDDGTTTNNQQLTFECVDTIHCFTNKKSGTDGRTSGFSMDESDNLCDFTSFFTVVQTPDTISDLVKP